VTTLLDISVNMTSSSATLRWIAFAGSALSVLLGLSHVVYGFTQISFAANDCNFYSCNSNWRLLISLAPDVLVDTFQPIIMGVFGMLYALPVGFRPEYPRAMSPPSSSVWGGVFHIVMALFANLGYMFWVGITVASINLLVGLVLVVVNLRNGGQRPKDVDELAVTNIAMTGNVPTGTPFTATAGTAVQV
jgi:hypothetical protein